jgi:HSP20 family protein
MTLSLNWRRHRRAREDKRVALRRSDPLRDLLTLQERMNRLFDESLTRGRGPEGLTDAGAWAPLCDVFETPEAFVFQVELPGVLEDDVEIRVDADRVSFHGERRPLASARPECYHRMERGYGAFSRSFELPETVDPSRVSAQFKDGLLRLEVAKAK